MFTQMDPEVLKPKPVATRISVKKQKQQYHAFSMNINVQYHHSGPIH